MLWKTKLYPFHSFRTQRVIPEFFKPDGKKQPIIITITGTTDQPKQQQSLITEYFSPDGKHCVRVSNVSESYVCDQSLVFLIEKTKHISLTAGFNTKFAGHTSQFRAVWRHFGKPEHGIIRISAPNSSEPSFPKPATNQKTWTQKSGFVNSQEIRNSQFNRNVDRRKIRRTSFDCIEIVSCFTQESKTSVCLELTICHCFVFQTNQ